MFMYSRHQAGWFPFRAELQNPRAEEGAQDEADQNQDMQEMVSYRDLLLSILLHISREQIAKTSYCLAAWTHLT